MQSFSLFRSLKSYAVRNSKRFESNFLVSLLARLSEGLHEIISRLFSQCVFTNVQSLSTTTSPYIGGVFHAQVQQVRQVPPVFRRAKSPPGAGFPGRPLPLERRRAHDPFPQVDLPPGEGKRGDTAVSVHRVVERPTADSFEGGGSLQGGSWSSVRKFSVNLTCNALCHGSGGGTSEKSTNEHP